MWAQDTRMRCIFCAPHLPLLICRAPQECSQTMARIMLVMIMDSMAWEWREERNSQPGAIRASLCFSISRIQAWSPACWKDSCVSNFCLCVEGSLKNRISASSSPASLKSGPWFSQSAVCCKHFSIFGWQSWFVLLVHHISRIQLQFFHCR